MAKRKAIGAEKRATKAPPPERDRLAVVGYIRISIEEKKTGGLSLDIQTEQLNLYCRLHNLDLVAVEIDDGATGENMDRSGLRAAFARMVSGEAGGVLVAKLDRLTRKTRDLGEMIDDYFAEAKGMQLMCVENNVDTRTPGGRLVLNVLVSVSQWERETIVSRVKGALDHRRALGQRTGGVPFGYELDPDGARNAKGNPVALRPVPGEIRGLVVVAALAEVGRSNAGIASVLEGMGIPAKRGGAWRASSVQRLLQRPDLADTSETGVAAMLYRVTEGRSEPLQDFHALLTLYRSLTGKEVPRAEAG